MDAVNTHRVSDWLWTLGRPAARGIAHLLEPGTETVIQLSPPSPAEALAGEDAAHMRHAVVPGGDRR